MACTLEMIATSEPLKLSEFQTSAGIAFANQIILIDNPQFFKGFFPVMCPYARGNFFSKAGFWVNNQLGSRVSNGIYSLPKKNNDLFLGYFDKSMDHPEVRLESLFRIIEQVREKEFTLLIGKGDYLFNDSLANKMPNNLTRILANNVNIEHKRIGYLPMGRDFRNLSLLRRITPGSTKTYLCYCNFSVNTHPIRRALFESVKDKSYLTFDHMGEFLSYSISRAEFLEKLRQSKFCFCPRGNAIDTFRLWDCLYLGTIPIVVREAVFHDKLDDLPILFLDDYAQFAELEPDHLENVYQEFMETEFDYRKLTRSYWLNGIGKLKR